ncbi:MAG TPA: hypothetical protein ENN43_01795 [bacterium]|nr:hypothetical protein [bacterium]
MQGKTVLSARKKHLEFLHKGSEIAYDPNNKFHQVTFPFEYERDVYDFIDSFVNMVFADEKFRGFGALPKDKNMTGFYFDLIAEFPSLTWEKFSTWYFEKKSRLLENTRNVIMNSISSEKELPVEGLEFFSWLSVTTFFSLITEEYFRYHFEKLNIMRETLTAFLGQAYEIIMKELYEDECIDRLREEKTGAAKNCLKPFAARYCCMFHDVADVMHAEKIMFNRDRSVFVDRQLQGWLLAVLDAVVVRSKRLKKNDKARVVFDDMANIRLIFSDRREKGFFAKALKKDREIMRKMAAAAEKAVIEEGVRDVAAECGSGELLNAVRRRDVFEDLLFDRKLRSHLLKLLSEAGTKKARETARRAVMAADLVDRCEGGFFKSVSNREFEKVAGAVLENFTHSLRLINDLRALRSRYGRRSAYTEDLSGIRVMRQSVIKRVVFEDTGKETVACVAISGEDKSRIENTFEEGNLFYMRGEGIMYPGAKGSARGKKYFLFADLRNSTETTMKLTKDTAGFLTPYLNTVYRISKEQNGTEIYFAGDGYAAHFSSPLECVRTAYLIHREFVKLRREAEAGIRRKEAELFKSLAKAGIIDGGGNLKKLIPADSGMGPDIADFIGAAEKEKGLKVPDTVRIIAEEYSMPKVEIGIGITKGELFMAVVGDDNARFNIVLSPSLTLAARLSGSNHEVKEYMEKLYGVKNFPRRVYVRDGRHYNQGVAITGEVFNSIRAEAGVEAADKKEVELSHGVYYYYDGIMERYVVLNKMEEGVRLKGIEGDMEILEVFTPVTDVDGYVNEWIAKRKRGG